MRAVLCLAFALAAIPALAVENNFKAWHVACEDDGYCAASAEANRHPDGVPPYDYLLRIGRHAEQSYWEIAFVTVAAQADESAAFAVSLDGKLADTFTDRSEIGSYGSVTDFYLLGDKAQHVMDLMMPAHRIAISYTDIDDQPQAVEFPLDGLTAALLWIDDQQGRIGSERVASAAPYGLVPAGEGEDGQPQIPQAVLDRHAIDPECGAFEDIDNGGDFTVSQLDADHTLYLIPCWSAAYNFGWKAYVVSGDTIDPQYFADYSAFTGWTGTPYIVNYYYDPEFKELGSFYKARGIGDCGSSGTWKWNGYIFRLEEFRSRECDDENAENAVNADGQFPVIYAAPPETKSAAQ